MIKKVLPFLCIGMLLFFRSFGQQADYRLILKTDTSQPALPMPFPTVATDSLDVHQQLKSYIYSLRKAGYLLANADQLEWQDRQVTLALYIGKKYTLGYLKPGNLPDQWVRKLDKKERIWRKKPFDYTEISNFLEAVVNLAATKGHPFASVQLDSVQATEGKLSASVFFEPGPAIAFDTLQIEGNVKVSPLFLGAFLGVRPGQLFDQSRLDDMEARLQQLSFLKLKKPYRLSFQNEKATVYLELVRRPADMADGLISFYADPAQDNRLKLTGQLQLKLNNLFKSGRKLHLYWRKLQPLSQEFQLTYDHPVFLSAPVGVGAEVHLLKQDSTFLQQKLKGEISWIQGSSRLSVFSERVSSHLLFNTDDLEDERFRNVKQINYGLQWQYSRLNDPVYPTKGLRWSTGVAIGDKRSLALKATDSEEKQVQYHWHGQLEGYYPHKKRWVFMGGMQASAFLSDRLYQNELSRLGGFQNLRGFNEAEFYASHYLLSTLEMRFLLENESHLLLFYDQAALFDQVNDAYTYPSGLGAGLSFTTSAGVFNLMYALGRTASRPLNLQDSKIHFGFKGRF